VAIINSAMGVKRAFYRHYAAYLAAHGYHAITYDYRGIGDSIQPDAPPAYLWQWGAQDQTAVIDYALKTYPGATLSIVGHSVGGQIVGLTQHHPVVSRVLGIAAQSGHWRNWPGLRKLMMLTLWYAAIPVTTTLFGYLPARVLGGGENVPKGVAREWMQAGRQRGYVYDRYRGTPHHHYDDVRAGMTLVSFADDGLAPRAAVEALAQVYPAASTALRHVAPGDYGLPKIGHFGFFRRASEAALWPESLNWLGAHEEAETEND
jgi:predicted alpha/beta hydrolase